MLQAAAKDVEWLKRTRQGVLVLRRRHIAYPLRLLGFLRGLGLPQAARFGLGFLTRPTALHKFASWEHDRASLDTSAQADLGFARFVRERVGEGAYQAFYRPYAEKVWGLPADELSVSVAKKRISTAQPLTVLQNTLQQAILQRRQPPPTFAYPRLGMGALIQTLYAQAQAAGVRIRLGRRFTTADRTDPRWRYILYSGQIAELLPAPPSPLLHRGLYLVYLAVSAQALGPVDTFYVPEDRYYFGRVSVPHNFSPDLIQNGMPQESVLCVEIPEGRWGQTHDFVGRLDILLAQLRDAGILPKGVRITAARQIFLPHVYPLYRRGWLWEWQKTMQTLAADSRLFPMGRQGLFLHCNIDHCVQIARDVSAHIDAGHSSSAWIQNAQRYLDLRVRD